MNLWRRENPEPEPDLSPVERARVKEMEDEIRRLRMENEFLKGSGLLRADVTVAERCAPIHAAKDNYEITLMCRLMRVPRSTYYAWTHRAETPTQARRRALAAETTQEFDDSRQTLGCRRIAAALGRRGVACSVGLVADLMRELGPAAVQPRAYKRTTLPRDAPTPASDLIGRDFTAATTLNTYSHLWPDRDEQTRAAVGAVLRARQPGKDKLC